MSKQSGASLSVVPVQPLARVSAPDGLSREEAELWRQVVDSKPADWFGEDSAPLLVEYVRAKVSCDVLHAQVQAALAGGDPKEIKDAMQLRDMESRRLLSIGTKLRLTQQSRYTPKAAATADRGSNGRKPWQAAGR
jgi:hypothetical protein